MILRKQFLEAPFQKLVFNAGFVRDVIVNFFGFIPFGLSLSFVLYGFGIGGIRNVVIVVVASAGASFGIELVQVWLPSRTSSLLDLVLNILGGLAAASGLTRLVGSTKK